MCVRSDQGRRNRPSSASEVCFPGDPGRLAALCNEQSPGSVSPYGGEGELSIGTNPSAVFRVAFTNTPGEQVLELRLSEDDKSRAIEDDAIEVVGQSPRTMGSNSRVEYPRLLERAGCAWT